MKFDKDCVRDILIYLKGHIVSEKDRFNKISLHIVSFDELCKSDEIQYEHDIIQYAIEKMEEYKLIKLNNMKNSSYINKGFKNYHITEITSYGHEFIDNLSNDEVWNRIKTAIENANIDECSLNMYFQYIYNEIENRFTNK